MFPANAQVRNIALDRNEKTTVVTLSGFLGFLERKHLEGLLPNPEEVERVVINFGAVRAIDSSIVAALVAYHQRFVAAQNDPLNIVLIVPPKVRRVLDMTGVSRLFTVLPVTTAD